VNVDQVNAALLAGDIDRPGVFPRLDALRSSPAVFRVEFGLDRLPEVPGVIAIRGARQYGKSTWLEGAMRDTIVAHGPGSALFLDGDHLRDADRRFPHFLSAARAARRPWSANLCSPFASDTPRSICRANSTVGRAPT
jgi:hypothetical protein